MRPIKEQHLQIRVDPQRKQLLERAADAAHLNLSAFVLGAASRHAEEVPAERTVVELSQQAAQAFSNALARPVRVNERLAAALDRPCQFRWVDCGAAAQEPAPAIAAAASSPSRMHEPTPTPR